MSTTTHNGDPRLRLRDVEQRLSEGRQTLADAKRTEDTAKAALVRASESPGRITEKPEYREHQRALASLRSCEELVDAATEEQTALLAQFSGQSRGGPADRNGPRSGDYHGGGWATVARELDPSSGRDRIQLPMSDLMRREAFASVTPTPGSGLSVPLMELEGVLPLGRDIRALYPVFTRLNLEDELGISDWKQTGERKVTGSVERDPVATSAKAKLDLTVSLEQVPARQMAVVIDKIPAKLLTNLDQFQAFLMAEAQFQLDLALDKHCIEQIVAAAPGLGEVGADMISKLRNGVKAMRAQGANPTVVGLPPTIAAELDLVKTEALGYIFSTRADGGASPIWKMAIVEDAASVLTEPLLIDPAMLGVLYAGLGTILLDPYSGMSENLVRLRLEFDALFHVRQATGGYLIGK